MCGHPSSSASLGPQCSSVGATALQGAEQEPGGLGPNLGLAMWDRLGVGRHMTLSAPQVSGRWLCVREVPRTRPPSGHVGPQVYLSCSLLSGKQGHTSHTGTGEGVPSSHTRGVSRVWASTSAVGFEPVSPALSASLYLKWG